jgi:Methylase involved in ubiquinone/menaquinone biosynthesis
MDPEKIKDYFSGAGVVCDYARAVLQVGLWESERILFTEYFKKSARIIELGCGAGRISFGLWRLGYKNLTATDFASGMVEVAKNIFEDHKADIACLVEDATALNFDDETFEGAIFGFNGLMQIPLRERRRAAMCEIFRVLKPGSYFIFTTHDRDAPQNSDYWQKESALWLEGKKQPELDEYGDICYQSPHGKIFIHSPTRDEVEEDMALAGFSKILEKKRADIAYESQAVTNFSDECIFRIYLKK